VSIGENPQMDGRVWSRRAVLSYDYSELRCMDEARFFKNSYSDAVVGSALLRSPCFWGTLPGWGWRSLPAVEMTRGGAG